MNFRSKKKLYLLFILLSLTVLSLTVQNAKVEDKELLDTDFNQDIKPITSAADLYQVEWSRLNTNGDSCYSLELTSSEDVIISGQYSSSLMYVIKYDKSGNLQWSNTFTGRGGGRMTLDSSNNIYLVGYEEDSNSGDRDFIIYKLNSAGTVLWTRTFDKNKYDYPAAVVTDGYNDLYVIGHTFLQSNWENKDFLIVKYSSSGTYLWDQTLDIDAEDYGLSITSDNTNNVYIAGATSPKGSMLEDYVAAKYDRYGNLQWSKRWGGIYDERANDIIVDSANNIYITGFEDTPSNHEEVSLMKLSNNGNIIWSRLWSGYGVDVGYSIDLDTNNNIYIGGGTYEQSAGLYDILLLTFDSGGNFRWWGRWGGVRHDVGRAIAVDSTKSVYIGGYYGSSAFIYDICLLKYNPAPSININSPVTNQLFSQTSPNFDVDISDSDLLQKYYTVDDGAQYTFSGSTGNINQAAWDSCSNGLVSLKFYGRDPFGSVYEEVIVMKDIIAPVFSIVSPTHLQFFADIAPNYILSSSDTDINGIWYTLNGGDILNANMLTGQLDQAAWNDVENGSIFIEFFMSDNLGNVASKEVEIYKNFEIPIINVNSPLPNHKFGLLAPAYDITITGILQTDSMWYTLKGGQNISITETQGRLNQLEWDSLSNGSVTILFYANNTSGNLGKVNVIIYKDIYTPYIEIFKPISNKTYGIKAPNFNVSITSTILDSRWYSLNYNANITIYEDIGEIKQSLWDSCNNGPIILTFFANNSAGVLIKREIDILKDTRSPNITIVTPQKSLVYRRETIDFNLLIDDPFLDKAWYSLNSGMNYSFSGLSGTINQEAWDLCGNGTVLIRFNANNSFGNAGFAEINIRKDILFPFITILSPIPDQDCGIEPPFYNLSISSNDIDTIWYSLNDGVNVSVLNSFGKIKESYWNLFGTEDINISFYVNNSYGIDFKYITVHKDNSTPNITIISPQAYDVFGIESIQFNITVEDPNLHSMWYTLNNGPKILFNQMFGLIDQFYWESCGNGTVTITFYANNSFRNTKSAQISVIRDIYFPIIDIISPLMNQFCGIIPPSYNITVSTLALDTIWFTINDSSNYILTSTEGIFEQSIWDLYGKSNLNIKFWANNTYGQISYQSVLVKKVNLLVNRKAFAIIVGVSNYPGSFNDLRYCRSDAITMHSLLRSQYNFESENMILLTDAQATRTAIFNAFTIIKNQMSSDDIFFFYFSGHGGEAPSLLQFICPYDSIPAYPQKYIFDLELDFLLDQLPCDEKIVVIDACNSGGFISEVQASNRFIMTACQTSQLSWETTELRHGVFSFFFYDSIFAATDSNGDGVRSLEEQFSYASAETINYMLGYGELQQPSRYDGISGQTVLFPSIGSLSLIPIGNELYYSFYLYGHGLLTCLNITICSVLQDISLTVVDLMHHSPSNTGFGYYSGIIQLEEGYNVSGYEFRAEIDGYNFKSFVETYGDSDNDGLYDLFEIANGMNPVSNDTDNDGLSDYEEYIIYNTDPLNSDSDYDGLTDFEEVDIHNTDPLSGDTDSDELLDGEEVLTYFTNPTNDDTDSDGLLDGEEVNVYNTDPLDSDTDSDGLLDGEEVNVHSTDPLSGDTDTDTMPDKWEVDYSLNPLVDDAMFDPDSDDLVNILEYQHNTDPQNPDTDSDSWTDGDEILVYDTDPLDPNDYPDTPELPPTLIPGYDLIILISIVGWISLVFIRKKKFSMNCA